MLLDSELQRRSAAHRARTASALFVVTFAAAACTPPANASAPKKESPQAKPVASTDAPLPPEPALPPFAGGALTAVDVPGTIELSLVGRGQDGAFELLAYALPTAFAVSYWLRNEVQIAGAQMPYAFVGADPRPQPRGVDSMRLWVRRPLGAKATEISGECYTPPNGQPGQHYRFHAPAPDSKLDPKLPAAWAQALARDLDLRHGAFYGFAADKLRERNANTKPTKRNQNYDLSNGSDVAALIGTTTGRSSVQEALMEHRSLYLDLSSSPRKVAIDKLVAPRLTRHPWSAMLAQLGKKPTDEPLAAATPADFYFVRVSDFSTFLDLSSVAESWGTPALDALDGRSQDRGLRARYETQLALEQGELSRAFGPSVVLELAVVGSDPYLVEGSDLTLIFRVKSGPLFEGALLKAMATFSAAHPGGDTQKFNHEGVEVSVTRSADGQIRRHRATVNGLELVSNSPGSIRRVISAIHGKAPRLSDEPDFSYMLARDADRQAPILAFAGDRFVESVIGPQQKIKEAERALSLAELSRPGYAALLHGYLTGHSPASAADLVHENLLSAADLRPGGVAAGWQPGAVAQSSRGSTQGSMPLIDMPPLTQVTAAEQLGYAEFARSYEGEWSEYVDPFAVRVSRGAGAGGAMTLDAELRVLPLLRREYREFTSSVGNAHVQAGAIGDGFRMLLGVGKDAEVRRWLTSATERFTEHALTFDWIGDYAFIGVADRNELVNAARYEHDISPEKPDPDRSRDEGMRAAAQTPAYAGLAIRSAAGAAIALAVLKRIGDDVASNSLIWSEARKHRGVALMSIHSNDPEDADIKLYYALTPHALLFSLNPTVLEVLIDQYLDGKAPIASDAKANARDPQLVIDLKGKKQGALATVLSWLLTKTLFEDSSRASDAANAVFRGAPELAGDADKVALLMRNYFGSVLKTPEGRAYTFGPDGVRDPLRGSASSPAWPAIPVPGSPVAEVVDRLESLRSEVSFDREPSGQPGTVPLQSLRVHLTLSLR